MIWPKHVNVCKKSLYLYILSTDENLQSFRIIVIDHKIGEMGVCDTYLSRTK